jgi:hypothetical protein
MTENVIYKANSAKLFVISLNSSYSSSFSVSSESETGGKEVQKFKDAEGFATTTFRKIYSIFSSWHPRVNIEKYSHSK